MAIYLRTYRGIECPHAVLTVEQVLEVRRRIDAGEPYRKVAEAFGIGWTTAWRVGKRVGYRNIPEETNGRQKEIPELP